MSRLLVFINFVNYFLKGLIEMYSATREIEKVFKIYDHMKKENLKHTYKTLNNCLEMSMRVENAKRIVELLQDFKRKSKILK